MLNIINPLFGPEEYTCLKNISNNLEIVSLVFNIDSSDSQSYINDPPYVRNEIILLLKEGNIYKTQVFIKLSSSRDFGTSNSYDGYFSVFPYGRINFVKAIDYNVFKLCYENNIYSIRYVNYIRRILKKKFSDLIIDIIISYVALHIVNFENYIFQLENQEDIKNSIIVTKYFNYFSSNIFLTLKRK